MKNQELLSDEYTDSHGIKYIFEYLEADSFDELDKGSCTQAYGVCFHGDKIVIGYEGHKDSWGLIGGTIEKGETFEETLLREVREESNMEVLSYLPIGYQRVTSTKDSKTIFQLRYVCNVNPYGPFVSDPADSITEIKLINPDEYKQYFDWGKRGDMMIRRALELMPKLN